MRITFLGTGTSQGIPVIGCNCEVCKSDNPKNTRLRSSIYIHSDFSHKILIDTTPDLRQQLLRENINDIDFILYTHEHNDHTAGLDDVRPINFKHNKMLNAYGLQRVIEDIKKRFHYAFDDIPYPGSPQIILNCITKDDLLFNYITCINVNHGNIDILGYRIGDFAYLTDIKHIPLEEMEKLKGLKSVVISALQKKSHHSHQSLEEAIALAQTIDANSTYLTHISHTMGLCEIWENELPDGIKPAYDGLVIEV